MLRSASRFLLCRRERSVRLSGEVTEQLGVGVPEVSYSSFSTAAGPCYISGVSAVRGEWEANSCPWCGTCQGKRALETVHPPLVAMGASESKAQVTPSRPLRNHLLSRVNDPRSPTSGIPRTPIEVGESPRNTPQTAHEEEEEIFEEEILDTPEISDPRSPTNGITRTPLRPPMHAVLNNLAKQLSEVFVAEDSVAEGGPLSPTGHEAAYLERQVGQESQMSQEACVGEKNVNGEEVDPVAEMAETQNAQEVVSEVEKVVTPNDQEESLIAEKAETVNDQESIPVAQAVVSTEPIQGSGQQQRIRGKSPRSSGVKNVRQRPRKSLLSSSSGRSPLRILQEDNSPNTTAQHRQGKKLSYQTEPALPHRALKISHGNWESSLNKENAEYGHSTS